MKAKTAVFKVALPLFGELPKHCIWTEEAREELSKTRQCVLHRADWKCPVTLWQMLSGLCFTQADGYIHVLSIWIRHWSWFPGLKNYNTISHELDCAGRMRACHCRLIFHWSCRLMLGSTGTWRKRIQTWGNVLSHFSAQLFYVNQPFPT